MKNIKNKYHIGILGAMPEEVKNGLKSLFNVKENIFGDLIIYSGEWVGNNNDVSIYLSLAWSGWGKVSASRAATRLLSLKNEGFPEISTIIFNGVAGSASNEIDQWDLVIPSALVQHDMDSSPIFERFVIPALKLSKLKTNQALLTWATKSINEYLEFNKDLPFGKIYSGLVGTGDKFISDETILKNLKNELPDLNAIEMEGAAVAQVAMQEKVSWLIIRVISDNAKSSAAESFKEFLGKYEQLSWTLIDCLLRNWPYDLFNNK